MGIQTDVAIDVKPFFRLLKFLINVVVGDQYDGYRLSTLENCPNADYVLDRFHIVQTFNKYLNDQRTWIHQRSHGEVRRLSRGKFKQLFTKKADRRNKVESRYIKDAMEENNLELIKEAMYELFDSVNESEARSKFEEIGRGRMDIGIWRILSLKLFRFVDT